MEKDYAVIRGTKKQSLLKPGAEKLLRLFGLGLRMRLADKDVDRFANFAMFTYRAEVFHLKTGVVVAECEGTANSQEVKYRARKVWREVAKDSKGKPIKELKEEETPVCDVLNTLMKMAQKRAMIGATIIATQGSDFFSQDIEDESDAEQVGAKARVEGKEEKGEIPSCCGKPMMVSKFPDRETGEFPFYCITCKAKKPQVQKFEDNSQFGGTDFNGPKGAA